MPSHAMAIVSYRIVSIFYVSSLGTVGLTSRFTHILPSLPVDWPRFPPQGRSEP